MSLHIDTQAGLNHFKTADPRMAALAAAALQPAPPHHDRLKPIMLPTPKQPEEYFASIVSSIISQQISTKAADAVQARVETFLGDITPATVQHADFEQLKSCSLSTPKTKYIKHNAEIWHTIPTSEFQTMDDAAVIAELTKLYGIGRWTAEMFLMFSLARPDVFSYGDLVLMNSLYQQYSYYPHWKRKVANTVASWSPHRTLASLTLWWHKDGGPVLL